MKKLGKLKLNKLNKAELENREMNNLLGGGDPGDCTCGCHYSGTGGSSSCDNGRENWTNGYSSYGGGDTYGCACTYVGGQGTTHMDTFNNTWNNC